CAVVLSRLFLSCPLPLPPPLRSPLFPYTTLFRSAIALIALARLSGVEWSAIPSSVRGLLSLENDRPSRTDNNLPIFAAPDCRFHTIMGCRRPGPPGSAPRAVVGEHREFEPQPVGGLGRRQTGDLLDPSQPMPQGVRVHVQPAGGLGGVADRGEVHAQRLEQAAVVVGVVPGQRAGRPDHAFASV